MHVLRRTAVASLGPRRAVRGHAALRGCARRPVRMFTRPVRRLRSGYPRLHLLLHARLPAAQPREEKDVLGAARAALSLAVRSRRWAGVRRASGRKLRLLQRLRWHRTLVGPVAREPVHA